MFIIERRWWIILAVGWHLHWRLMVIGSSRFGRVSGENDVFVKGEVPGWMARDYEGTQDTKKDKERERREMLAGRSSHLCCDAENHIDRLYILQTSKSDHTYTARIEPLSEEVF
jgi:hypothetical protein